MIKIGIIGGAGYTAGELLRILIHHRKTQIKFVHSNSNAGKPVTDVHKDLIGETNIAFTDELPFSEIDALFLCLGHGEAKGFLEKHPVPANIHIIDLSQDFRIQAPGHDYVYGLPELNKDAIRHAQHIANPGCFATAIQLAILPLASAHLLKDEVHVNAITGSTGAGQKPTDTTHFSWRNNNMSAYEIFKHRHLKEIGQSIRQLQPDFHHDINFIPVRGAFTRGIFATVYTKTDKTLEELQALYKAFYKDSPFVHVVDYSPHLKQVVNTNKGLVYLEKHGDKVVVISMIDNLIKGASGQAIENMNLMFGLDQTEGLKLKSLGM